MKRECPTCGDERLVVVSEGTVARATRCPTCYAVCPLCEGTGYMFAEDARGYEVARPCACVGVDKRIDLLNRARLPGRYADATFTSFKSDAKNKSLQAAHNNAFKFAREFRESDPGLLYWGACGTGKTHLLVSILRYLAVKRGIAVRYVEFVHLLSDLKARFGDPEQTGDPLADLVAVPVLAIDELGKNRGTEWELGVLDELISKRYNANRTTLFATNLSPQVREGKESLPDRMGERIISRLNEMCVLEHLNASDYRKIKARAGG